MNEKSDDENIKKNQTDIGLVDYLLIGGGILLLPLYLVGLIFLGIFLWRLGDKWQKQDSPEFTVHFKLVENENSESEDLNMKSFSNDTLEEMK